MTACDYCLSGCSDGSRSLDDEDCGPSRECFHVDLGGPSEGNLLGMPEDGDLPRPVPRVDIPRELAVAPVPAGGHDPQLEQIRGVQARLDEGAGALEPIRRDVGQAWANQLSHPILEGKPNANHVRARISYSRTQQLHNMDIITQCSNSIKREIIVDYIIRLRRPYSPYNKSKCGKETQINAAFTGSQLGLPLTHA
jgi:hypothetical protein